MAYTLVSNRSTVLVCWGEPEVADLDRLVADIRHLDRGPHGMMYISVVPEDRGAPPADVARVFGERMHELSQLCSSIHKVFEGSGFFVGFKRSVLTGILQTAAISPSSGKKRNEVRVYSSFVELMCEMSADQQMDISTTIQLMKEAGELRAA